MQRLIELADRLDEQLAALRREGQPARELEDVRAKTQRLIDESQALIEQANRLLAAPHGS